MTPVAIGTCPHGDHNRMRISQTLLVGLLVVSGLLAGEPRKMAADEPNGVRLEIARSR